jgi:hypothetical protein
VDEAGQQPQEQDLGDYDVGGERVGQGVKLEDFLFADVD